MSLRSVAGRSNVRDVKVYQADDYVAVCIVREGGTPEWHVSVLEADGGLGVVPASEAEEKAQELGLT